MHDDYESYEIFIGDERVLSIDEIVENIFAAIMIVNSNPNCQEAA